MEPITCVVDAVTLIEHIHEIKSWTYDGDLNLVMPLCTIERVEKLYQTKKEQEVKALDPPKKRSSWKNVRKEHPAFDINLQVALEFFKRMEAEESTTSITFQKITEEYSPWKGVELQQEKVETKEGRPSTFAQALAKSNIVNGSSGVANMPKGPTKPKLVAKASGFEQSPWKMNKKAPRVSPKEVPEALRPLLSYTLWQLYENIATLSNSNPTILLTCDSKTSAVAHKLNINVMQIGQLRQAIATKKTNEVDRNVGGDLEQDFGLPEPNTSLLESEIVHLGSKNPASQAEEDRELNIHLSENTLNGNHSTMEKIEDVLIAVIEGLDKQASETNTSDDSRGTHNDVLCVDQDEQKDINKGTERIVAATDEDDLDRPEHIPFESGLTVSKNDELRFSQEPIFVASDINLLPQQKDTDAKEAIDDRFTVQADAKSFNKVPVTSENNSVKSDFVPDSVGVSTDKHNKFINEKYLDSPQIEAPSHLATANGSSSSSQRSSHELNSLPVQIVQELEDSDEEVVVFNPRARRFSAKQKTPPSHAQTVMESPKTNPVTASVIASMTASATASDTTSATIETAPKPTSAKTKSPKLASVKINSYKPAPAKQNLGKSNPGKGPRPQTPVAPAAVIDPDFFGRSSVVSIRPHVQNGHPRHSPRGSPRRGPRIPDSDVDYVLTSGTSRESARGRGKLWVP